MFPAAQSIRLDVEAISGIMGSISIACWLVVFSPQIIENFRRSSTEGLSIFFVMIWLTGDVFNVLGAVLQGVLPTMIILAVYYAFADTVLLSQCFYYRGFRLSDKPSHPPTSPKPAANPNGTTNAGHEASSPTETSPLLAPRRSNTSTSLLSPSAEPSRPQHRASSISIGSVSAVHLSPATPLLPASHADAPASRNLTPQSPLQAFCFNFLSILLVCAAGVFGWWLSQTRHPQPRAPEAQPALPAAEDELEFDVLGQVFGYLCAAFYLGSRLPQLLLNWRRKSTEGVSMLFFLFACVGNLTYVLSIFAYEPPCAKAVGLARGGAGEGGNGMGIGMGRGVCAEGEWAAQYGKWIVVNLSWLFGSAGTFLLDLGVFAQFWMYRGNVPRELGVSS